MAKERSATMDFLVYAVVRVFVCVIQMLPYETARGFARWLGWVIMQVDKRHRNVARENLNIAFPGQYTPTQIDRMVAKVYEHFCTMLIEILFMPRRLHVHNWKRYADMERHHELVEGLLSGRSMLLITGHLGNWEIGGYALSLFGFGSYAIARPIDNPYLDDFLRSIRERSGQKMLAKQGDFDKIQEVLASGGILATVADQDAGPRGLFVDFFGKPASTHKAVAIMALEHNVPMMVSVTVKKGDRYYISGSQMIWPEKYDRSMESITAITQQFTKELEMEVRAAPTQYFWLHRRWKHQPKVRAKKSA